MTTLFVTSSGTEIGKTFVTTLLVRQLRAQGRRVAALKPVISGMTAEDFADSDTALLLDALERPATHQAVADMSPWRFQAALSPDMAAALEDRAVPFDAVVDHCRTARTAAEDVLVIEGVGGIMVPLDDRHTVLDWLVAVAGSMTVRPVLVVGSYLGTLSHTLTAAAVMSQQGVPPTAVVVSESADSTVSLSATTETLARFLPDTPIVTLPRLPADGTGAPDLTALAG